MKSLPRVAVLASGNGSNLQAILDEVKSNRLSVDIRVVFSDKASAPALERAKRAGVEALTFSPKEFPSREAFDEKLVSELKRRDVEWIVLAGFMRILSPIFVRGFWKHILNIHPALLPKYPGIHSIERAFAAGEKEVGVTVHFVDEGVDTGAIVLQDTVQVEEGDTLETLTERVHLLEHRLFPEAIRRVIVDVP